MTAVVVLIFVGVLALMIVEHRYEKRTGKSLLPHISEWGQVTNPYVIDGMIVACIAFALWYFFVRP